MSEYQYHEWQSIDRLLTPDEQAAVYKLSSHIEVSSSKAVVTYNWSDFKHDPREVLLKYFDAYFYQANWGSLRLMFRFPEGMLKETDLEPYLDGEYISFETHGEYQVLDINLDLEEGGWIEEGEIDLSDFTPLRADLLQGDYRLLFLARLKQMTIYGEPGYDEDERNTADDIEPPVPPGLKKLTPALENFIGVFDLDPFLVEAAAEASPDLPPTPAVDYLKLIANLSRAECDEFLALLANGDARAGMALRKRLGEFLPQSQPIRNTGKRSLAELIQRSYQLSEAEKRHKAAEARKKHNAEMQALAIREPQVWLEVDRLLENGQKIASVYNEATALLMKLQELSEFQDTRDAFHARIQQLAGKYASRPSLMKRWKQKGWI